VFDVFPFVPLTLPGASVCIARVKWFFLALVFLTGVSCTTLENRRDLYRAPGEGYERDYPQPPPTRKPASGPIPAPETSGAIERNGAITFPEERLPEAGH
jgi:hypothetical protein